MANITRFPLWEGRTDCKGLRCDTNHCVNLGPNSSLPYVDDGFPYEPIWYVWDMSYPLVLWHGYWKLPISRWFMTISLPFHWFSDESYESYESTHCYLNQLILVSHFVDNFPISSMAWHWDLGPTVPSRPVAVDGRGPDITSAVLPTDWSPTRTTWQR